MKTFVKTLKIIGNTLLWLFVAFAVFMTVLVFSAQSNKDGLTNIFGRSLVTVESDSMKPVFSKGDLIIDEILTNDKKPKLQVGDVITYYLEIDGKEGEELNTHRIVDKYDEGGYTYYITKGDNNSSKDAEPVNHTKVLAKFTGTKIGVFGSIIRFMRQPTGFLCVIVLPLVIFFLFELYNFISVVIKYKSKGNKLSKEDEDEIKKRAVEEYLKQQQEQNK